MPITKSAKKTLKQSVKKRKINLFHKNRMKKIIKEIKELLIGGEREKASGLVSLSYKYIDKALKGGVIKENTASRKKSLIARITNK